ncbi:MAG: tRNA uridine-5-carboxymethylaminomethyl(34) synthesis GTPase MnmE [Candidatus Aminicenantes bacterium]|nr:tRNA uridine-5-carboxymethylaminomethyl(34) synthesis GTPase MnmE [Candidatus Aminicenantes bacterium]
MDRARLQDTIIAVSTPPGIGGLGVLRLSGPESLAVARKIFFPARKITHPFPPLTAVFGKVREGGKGRVLDEAFMVYFPALRSYTREDVVEISCHGSPAVLEEAVRLGVAAGAKPALPGEFTLRAYLRGRIDILQAEAVQSLIQSVTLEQAQAAIGQVRGSLSRSVARLREKLVELMALIEAGIEFSEEAGAGGGAEIRKLILDCREAAGKLAASYETGRAITEGIRVAIAGKPNAGKSTLFNALLGRERAIVAPLPGTTRDYISERLPAGGTNIVLTDMAGLGEARDPLEEEGVKRSRALADESDGILLILDASRPDTKDDRRFVSGFRGRKLILVFNKTDLPVNIDRQRILSHLPGVPHLDVSALRGSGVGELKEMMSGVFSPGREFTEEIVLHLRQKLLLGEIERAMTLALERMDARYSEEFCAEEVRAALGHVGRLTGEVASDEVLEAVFGRFCVGK